MNTIPTVGDWGTKIYVQILDELDDAPQNTSAATMLTARVEKPDGTELDPEITLVPSTDPARLPAAGWAQFTVPDAAWLDQDGLWRLRPRYAITGVGSWRSARPAAFRVAP